MPRKPSFSYKKTHSGWKVEIPASVSSSGDRERSFFKTRDEARAFAQKLEEEYKKNGTNAIVIKPSLADEAVRAAEILAPTGASLVKAATRYREQWEMRQTSLPFVDAVQNYLDARQDLRPATLTSYRYTLINICHPLHTRILADIELSDLHKVLQANNTQKMHISNFRAFWRWAAKQPRAWCKAELADALENPRHSNDSDIGILSPDDVRALLQAAEEQCPAAACAYAIAIYGGVRMAELSKLTWSAVREEVIEIGKSVAKRHARRLVPICPTLRLWLDTYRNDAANSDLIVPANWTELSKCVRRRAGWDVVARRLQKPPKPTRGKWPGNACRHTCASIQVAIGTPLETLTFAFGHSGGHDLLRRHYVARLSKKDALAILRCGPEGKRVPNLIAS